jgi:hypothetical protein
MKEKWYELVNKITAWRLRYFNTYTEPASSRCDYGGAEDPCPRLPVWVWLDLNDPQWDVYACENHKEPGFEWTRLKGR